MSFIVPIKSAIPKRPASSAGRNGIRRLVRVTLIAVSLVFLTVATLAESPEISHEPDSVIPQKILPDTAQDIQISLLAKKIRARAPAFNPYETNPKRIDYLKLEEWEAQAAENRERARKRVVIPPAAMTVVESDALAQTAARKKAALAAAIEAPMYHGIKQTLLMCLIVCTGAFVGARVLAPQFHEWLKNNLSPWSIMPALNVEGSPIPLAEEKSFAEFQAKFRVGTAAPVAVGKPSAGLEAAEDIFASANRQIARIRKLMKDVQLSTVEKAQRKLLRDVYDKIQPLKGLLTHGRVSHLEKLTFALDLLVKQLTEQSGTITSSTVRTVAQGVAVLAELCDPKLDPEKVAMTELKFLVVDDEVFSRYALSLALKRTLNEPEVAEEVVTALKLAEKNSYDLIFLDISMPGMDGFELCAKIRGFEKNRHTPVVFVTSLRDFDTRAKSIICGARDLISKPFLTFELIVKTMTLVTRERLGISMDMSATDETVVTQPAKETATTFETKTIVKPAKNSNGETTSLSKPAQVFLKQAGAQARAMKESLALVRGAGNPKTLKDLMHDFYLLAHSFAVGAEACEQFSLAQIGHGLESLLKKLLNKAGAFGDSTFDTIEKALGLLEQLCADHPARGQASTAPIGVLAVDDDPIARRFMTNALQLKFLSPQSAVDGNSAVAMAMKQTFDVIFLDVQMPDLDGFEVCKKIRELPANQHTPVVFVTSHDQTSIKDQLVDCRGNDFISKPYICSELALKTITLALGNRLALQMAQSDD